MSQAAVSANRLELLQIADSVAREKSIEREVVLGAMEDAIQRAARSRYGAENEIRATIDPKTGEITLVRLLEVVETVENESTEIRLEDHPYAKKQTLDKRSSEKIEIRPNSIVIGGNIYTRL